MTKPTRVTSLVRACATVSLTFGLAATSSDAATLTLQDLLNGQTVAVGHVEFGNFHNYLSVGAGGAAAINPAGILVTPVVDGFNLGLAFESAAFGVEPGQSKLWSFEFDGAVISEGLQLTASSRGSRRLISAGPAA